VRPELRPEIRAAGDGLDSEVGGMRCHFSNCTDPLKEGVDTLAVCGKVVKRARFAMFADQELISLDELRKTIGLCGDCRHGDLPQRLVYIVYQGQEAEVEA
jgi:hypothetical protein